MSVTVYNDLIARHEYRDLIAGIENMETHVGRAGWVTISKDEFRLLPYATIRAFFDYVAAEGERGDVNYFLIAFGDGSGIVFPSCCPVCPQYGKIDHSGGIEKLYGYVDDRDGFYTLIDGSDEPLSDDEDPSGVNGI